MQQAKYIFIDNIEFVHVYLYNMLYLNMMIFIIDKIIKLQFRINIKNLELYHNRYLGIQVFYQVIRMLIKIIQIIRQIIVNILVIFNRLFMIKMDYIGK